MRTTSPGSSSRATSRSDGQCRARLGLLEERRIIPGVHERVVAPNNQTNTSVRFGRRVERRVDSHERISVKPCPAVLMPVQASAALGGFVHEHRPERRDRHILAVHVATDPFGHRMLHPGAEEAVDLEALNLAVRE